MLVLLLVAVGGGGGGILVVDVVANIFFVESRANGSYNDWDANGHRHLNYEDDDASTNGHADVHADDDINHASHQSPPPTTS